MNIGSAIGDRSSLPKSSVQRAGGISVFRIAPGKAKSIAAASPLCSSAFRGSLPFVIIFVFFVPHVEPLAQLNWGSMLGLDAWSVPKCDAGSQPAPAG